MKKIILSVLVLFIVAMGLFLGIGRFSMRNTVSIILPAYNVEKYIDDCLLSLTSQSYKNLEIIAIDDNSTDHTYEILSDWAHKDKRIKLFHNEQNQGVALTRELALGKASGKYTMFVDSDDYISGTYIESMVRAARKSGANAVFNNSVVVHNEYNGKEETLLWWMVLPEGELRLPPACKHEQGYVWGKLFKTSFLRSVDISLPAPLRYHSDMYVMAVLQANLPSVFVMNHPAYYYRFRPGSLQTEGAKNHERSVNMLQAEKMLLTYLKKHQLTDKLSIDIFQLGWRLTMPGTEVETYYEELRKFIVLNQADLLHQLVRKKRGVYLQIRSSFIHAVSANETWTDFLKNTTQEDRNHWFVGGEANRLYCHQLLGITDNE